MIRPQKLMSSHLVLLPQIHRGLPAAGGQQPHLRGDGRVQVLGRLPGGLQRLVRPGRGHWRDDGPDILPIHPMYLCVCVL